MAGLLGMGLRDGPRHWLLRPPRCRASAHRLDLPRKDKSMPMVTNAPPVLDRAEPDSGWVAEFEWALRDRPNADLRAFLPAATASAFVPTLVELVRIDIERRWQRGDPKLGGSLRIPEWRDGRNRAIRSDKLPACRAGRKLAACGYDRRNTARIGEPSAPTILSGSAISSYRPSGTSSSQSPSTIVIPARARA
jgi:hypothetical protein